MIFSSLSDKLTASFKKLRSRGTLNEQDIKEAMREIKMALLEADVNFKVVKDFVASVSLKCANSSILNSLTPAQQVIKIVNDELISLLGTENSKLAISSSPPTVIMMIGLQGSGKTTSCAKLAGLYKKQGKRPLMVGCDIYRPAAIKQLQVLGEKLSLPVFEMGEKDPVEIAHAAFEHAKRNGNDMLFIDTAGRLTIDEPLMEELKRIKESVHPHNILLVLDSMTGQDAVTTANSFNSQIGIDGIIMTKLDSDTRGGAALSVRAVTSKPIKFITTGEKLDAIEPFYPDRLASRILGMGDVLSLIEKAQENFDVEQAEKLEKKIREQTFDLEDFLEQFKQLKKMGSMSEIAAMLPGVNAKALSGANIDKKQLDRTEAIILSMTKKERQNPSLLNFSRKKRIAAGSGAKPEDVNRLLKQYEQTKLMMRQMTKISKKGMPGKLNFPFM